MSIGAKSTPKFSDTRMRHRAQGSRLTQELIDPGLINFNHQRQVAGENCKNFGFHLPVFFGPRFMSAVFFVEFWFSFVYT